jgi:ATP:ADP antiporter, AAA family
MMPITDSRRRGLAAAISVALAAGFLLCGYECLRSTSNTLFKTAYGSQNLPIVMALTPPAMIAMLYLYGRTLSVLGPRRTLLLTSVASGAAILACYVVIQRGSFYEANKLVIPRDSAAGIATGVLYLVREAYVVLIIEQYWSFLNSHATTADARKFNGPVCGIGSLGAIVGAKIVHLYSKEWGTTAMVAGGAAAIVPAAIISYIGYVYCGEPARESKPAASAEKSDTLGLRLFRSNSMLPLMLVMILATQVISTVLDLSLNTILSDTYPSADEQNAWSGYFFYLLNCFAAIAQFAIAPLLLMVLPLTAIHLLGPLLNGCACGYFLMAPSLTSAAIAYMTFKVFDYSLFRAAKEILYIPLSFDARYRAKELIDVFGYRAGKGGSSALIALLRGLGWTVGYGALAVTALGGSVVWLIVIPRIARHYREKTSANEPAS